MGQGPAGVGPAGWTRLGYALSCMADDGGLSWPRGMAGIAMACRGEPPAPASPCVGTAAWALGMPAQTPEQLSHRWYDPAAE